MGNPPFQPLTLSRELFLIAYEWHEPKFEPHPADRVIAGLLRECEAQAQEAASLRQRLEEANTSVQFWTRETEGLETERAELKAQLVQAQQERDEFGAALTKLTADIPRAEKQLAKTATKAATRAAQAEARASQAEAALEEMQKMLDAFSSWMARNADDLGSDCRSSHLFVLAELQRRRSAPGQETQTN